MTAEGREAAGFYKEARAKQGAQHPSATERMDLSAQIFSQAMNTTRSVRRRSNCVVVGRMIDAGLIAARQRLHLRSHLARSARSAGNVTDDVFFVLLLQVLVRNSKRSLQPST